MSEPTRSPIKDSALRVPGQSLQEEWSAIWDDKVEPWFLVALFFLVLAGWEWFRHFYPHKSSPWIVSVMAIAVCGFAGWRFVRLRPRLKAIRQGIDGEKAVGQFLDRLREQGYTVFHDIVAGSFNVDHVLIGTGGVFTIETKTRSKPIGRDARVTYDGKQLLVDGKAPDRDPIVQAKSQARWLGSVLQESTGRLFPVQAVVVFPGWFIDPGVGKPQSVWVLEPKSLPGFLSHQAEVMSAEDGEIGDVPPLAFHPSN